MRCCGVEKRLCDGLAVCKPYNSIASTVSGILFDVFIIYIQRAAY
jgi:hypothetical protein